MTELSPDGFTARYAALVAAALDCIVAIDEHGIVLEFNPAAERTFGFRRDEIIGRPMVDFIVPPELRESHRRGFARYLATGEAHIIGRRIDISAVRSNGDVFPIELTITRVEQPGPAVFVAYLRDLTERRRLEDSRRLLLATTEILSSSLDHEDNLRQLGTVIVPAFADWYRVDLVQANGDLRVLNVRHSDPATAARGRELDAADPERCRLFPAINRAIRTGRSELIADMDKGTSAPSTDDARGHWTPNPLGLRSAIILPLRADGRTFGAITVASAESNRRYDERHLVIADDLARRASDALQKSLLFAEVSESRTRLEEQAVELESQADELERAAAELASTVDQLRATNEVLYERKTQAEDARTQADEANQAKNDFLASMSHELRTPLNAIMGYAQLLELGVHGTLGDDQQQDLRRIDRSAQHLLGLINDILNFAKIEAGRVAFHLQRVAIGDILERVEELTAPRAAAKHLRCGFSPGPAGTHVLADEEKVIQIFVNLVSNAVRYTPAGGEIAVSVRVEGDRVITDIRDTGVGIPSAKLTAVFEPFVQLDRGYAAQREGTGLGLAISRDLAHGMGGDLTAQSELDKGSVFSLTLPLDS